MQFRDSPPLTGFIITPFSDEFRPISDAVKEVLRSSFAGVAIRADDIHSPGLLIDQIKKGIEESDFCIADVTGNNPNVLWEVGYAHALNRPLIQMSQGASNLPFDIRAYRSLTYSADDISKLKAKLRMTVAAVLETVGTMPRILGPAYDELLHLATVIERRSASPTRHESVLNLLLAALVNERESGHSGDWLNDEAERLMRAVSRVNANCASNVFWWLIVHGVFVYPDIDGPFQAFDDDGDALNRWQDNIGLVTVSARGVHLLNQLKPLVAIPRRVMKAAKD